MNITRRGALAVLAALPAACAIQPLPPLVTRPLKGVAGIRPLRGPALGQSWTYRKYNGFNSQLLTTVREAVVAAGEVTVIDGVDAAGVKVSEERHSPWGRLLRDAAWDFPMNLQRSVALWPATLAVGATENIHTHYLLDGGSFRYWLNVVTRARQWEQVDVPAGTFDCLRVERMLRLQHQDITRSETLRRDVIWLAPEVGRWVAREVSGEYLEASGDEDGPSWGKEDRFRWELTAWA
jgi:hypothetical protein